MKSILLAWDESKYDPERSLSDLGVDSLDSVLILMGSLKELGIKFLAPEELRGRNIKEVIEVIQESLKKESEKK